MNIRQRLQHRLRALFHKRKLDAEMSEEMRLHIEMRTEKNIGAGMKPEEARNAAMRQFGWVESIKETCRDDRGVGWIENLGQDVRYGIRMLRKNPGFTTIALLTLALGIGANTSMFSVLSTLLFHEPPYPRPDNLIRVFRSGSNFQFSPHSPADFLDYRAQVRSFAQLAAYTDAGFNLAEPGQTAVQLRGMMVSGDFFAAIGVNPALGRTITTDDDQPGFDRVVVLSHTCWRKQFGGDPSIIDRAIRLDGLLVTVIGVMPAGFDDPLLWGRIDAWRPLALNNDLRGNRNSHWLALLGRLAYGVTAKQAMQEMKAVAANLARAFPSTNAETGVNFIPLVRSAQDETMRQLTWFAMGLAACVLLICCVNVANLLFARGALQAREVGIRVALGASRLRLIRQILTESVTLSVAGGALGLLVAIWSNSALSSRLQIADMPGFSLPINWRMLGFASTVAMASGVAFGFLPALLASRADPATNLKQRTRGNSGACPRLRHTLIVLEVALALTLLSSAGFFVRGLNRFLDRDHGWRTGQLLTARVSLPESKYRDDAALVSFYDRLESNLAALPGVQSAALSRTLPFHGFQWGQRFIVEGQPPVMPGNEPMRDVNGISPGYLETVGLALVAGRSFVPADLNGPGCTIISDSMARQLWPGQTAIGKRIAHPLQKEWQEVIGVVRDVSFASNLENPGRRPQTYRLLAREPDRDIAISLRCLAPPMALANAVRRAVSDIDPDLPVQDIFPATEIVQQDLTNYRLTGQLLSGFAMLGLLLATCGIYGVISEFVAQRTAEIGIRMALGAQATHVLRLVLGQGLRLTMLGVAFGLGGAWVAAQLLASFMPALPAAEPATATCVCLVLIFVAGLACWLPARRATKVAPIIALRNE